MTRLIHCLPFLPPFPFKISGSASDNAQLIAAVLCSREDISHEAIFSIAASSVV